MCEAAILVIDRDLSPREYQSLLRLVSPEKRERIGRFHFFADAQRSLLGDALARMTTGKNLGLPPHAILFAQDDCGKPFLAGHDGYHFSISHAGNYVACAADDEPIGIDIEIMRPMDVSIARRFFSEEEKDFLFSKPEEQQQKAFYQIWTSKESYIKRDGRGLRIPLPSFSVFSAEDVLFHPVFENEEAVCTVCTATQKNPPACRMYTIEDIAAGMVTSGEQPV